MEVAARTHTHTHTHNGRHCVSARIGPAMIQFKLARKRWTVKRKKKETRLRHDEIINIKRFEDNGGQKRPP